MLNRFLTFKRAVLGAYFSLAAFLLAHALNAFVADALTPPPSEMPVMDAIAPPESRTESPRALADSILSRGLFPLPQTAGDPATPGQPAAPQAPPLEVAKKVALIGTVSGREGGMMAILEELSTKKQTLYRLGEQIPSVGSLAAIERSRALFREGVQEEWLDLALTQQLRPVSPGASAAPVARPVTPQRRILDRREITSALADTTRLLTQAHAVPYLTDGKLDGFRLYNVMPSGFFDRIGLQTNDIVQRINGVELRDPGMLLSLFQQLRNERSVRVDLVRNAQRETLAYEIR